MVRGNRTYLRGVELRLAIGFEEDSHYVKVIYGSEKQISRLSPVVIIIKPGDISKGKLAKQIQNIFLKKSENSEQNAKVKALDLNEIVQAIPHNAVISEVINGN